MHDWFVRQEGHYRIVWVGDLWERATFMRGMESILLGLVVNPAFVGELLERLTEHILEPGITIQADVPRENLTALIDEARAA